MRLPLLPLVAAACVATSLACAPRRRMVTLDMSCPRRPSESTTEWRLSADSSIVGRVTHFDGSPVSGAIVQISPDSSAGNAYRGPKRGVLADVSGIFVIRRVTPGRWILESSRIGYMSLRADVTFGAVGADTGYVRVDSDALC